MEKPVLNVHTGMEEIDLRQDKNANGLVQLIAGRHHFRAEATDIRRSGTGPAGRSADRGFDSAGSRKMLDEQESFNGLCPRNSREMQRRLREDESFIGAQKRRAQTEGRIGILKNVFLQGVPRAKGFKNRELQVDWAVLAHNLWVVARCPWAGEEQVAAEAA